MSDKEEIVSIEYLYTQLEEMKKTQVEILTTVQNGLESAVKQNSENIEKLVNEFDDLKDVVKTDQAKQEGKTDFINSIKSNLGWITAFILTILSIAAYIKG